MTYYDVTIRRELRVEAESEEDAIVKALELEQHEDPDAIEVREAVL